MKKINIKGVQEIIYEEILSNGLKIYLYPMKNRELSSVSFITKFGGKDTEFIPYGHNEMIKVNEGVAHFLEHILCTDKNGIDMAKFYAKSGARSNAATSFDKTKYYFSCTKNFEENLIYLINLIQDAKITDEAIEKEKGIIIQEKKRALNNPYRTLYEENSKNVFHNHPILKNTLGSIEEISTITKDMLEVCYNTFYHPTNMYLVISGNFDLDKITKLIRKNQKSKEFSAREIPTLKEYIEPDEIVTYYEELTDNVEIPKMIYNIKIPLNELNNIKDSHFYRNIIFKVLFGPTSEINEVLKDKGYTNYNLGVESCYLDTHAIVSISAEGNYLKEIIEEINKILQNIVISRESLERYKRVFISGLISAYDDVDDAKGEIEYMISRFDKILNDEIGSIRNLNFKGLNKVIEALDLSHKSITIMKPKED
jgi:predicted Zn-dependent peptidase